MKWRRWMYTALLYLLLPYVIFHLLWRGRRQPEYLRHWGERFGCYAPRPAGPVVWVHTVSVGETRAAAPIIRELQARYPDRRILLTHMTPTGRQTGSELFGEDVSRCYLPYDYPFAARRFFAHFRPEVGILLETEIWPNLIREGKAAGVPICLLNARLSEKSFRRYFRFRELARTSLRELAGVAAQTEADRRRLAELGAGNVSVMGNVKFDITPPPSALVLGQTLRARFGSARPVFLAASTREGEEERILDALAGIGVANLLTVIVPRHPQRFDAVAQLLVRRAIPYRRRSEGAAVPPDTAVVLGDSMGEMFAYYAASDVALIGGSLLPFGGQNLIEACAVGKPVILGPHTYNFAEAAELAVEAGAALRVEDAVGMAREVGRLLSDPARRDVMGCAGLAFTGRHRGATQRAMALLDTYLAAAPILATD